MEVDLSTGDLDLSRILFLAHNGAWPTTDGGRRRDAELLPRLWRRALIDYVVVSQRPAQDEQGLRSSGVGLRRWWVFPDQSPTSAAPRRESRQARELLERIWQTYDAIHVEGHYLLGLLPPAAYTRVVLVEHNVESRILDQRTRLGEPIPTTLLDQLRRTERQAWRSVGRVIALTHDDATAITTWTQRPTPVITNGWDHLDCGDSVRVPARRNPDDSCLRLLFVANYAYFPNRDATSWLIEDILPEVRALLRDRSVEARLRLVGNAMPSQLTRAQDVEVVGWADDLAAEYGAADVVVVPLRIGGGIKVKVTEALYQGCYTVTTTVGAQGIPRDISGLAVADDARRFAELACAPILRPSEVGRLAAQREWTRMPSWNAASTATYQAWIGTGRGSS
ncbi:MAG: glycosyltransferase [Streptosporangiales bacterium]|nr:glycosyltransferase [Streptosporangiales bacterium]